MIFNLVTYSDFNENDYMETDGESVRALPIKLDIDLSYDQTISGNY